MGSLDKAEEAALIAEIVGGETEKFRRLVEVYQEVSLALVMTVVKDPAEAEDALQEAFVKAFRGLGRFRAEASFATWLYRIVINTAYTAAERARRHRKRFVEVPAEDLATEEVPWRGTEEEERSRRIREVLDRLKPREAMVLRLYYLAEQSVPEIAEVMRQTPGNVKVMLHRARKAFGEELEAHLGAEKFELL